MTEDTDQHQKKEEPRIIEVREGKHPYQLMEPPNELKKKMGFASDFSQEVLIRAEQAVRELGHTYINDLIYDVRELKENFEKFCTLSPGQEHVAALKKVVWHAHEIKGQGGSFGYPFVSRVSKSLCEYMHKLEEQGHEFDDLTREIMRAHISTLMVIADKRIRGDGGETGQLVAEGLQVCTQKHLARDPKFMKMDVVSYLTKLQRHMEEEE